MRAADLDVHLPGDAGGVPQHSEAIGPCDPQGPPGINQQRVKPGRPIGLGEPQRRNRGVHVHDTVREPGRIRLRAELGKQDVVGCSGRNTSDPTARSRPVARYIRLPGPHAARLQREQEMILRASGSINAQHMFTRRNIGGVESQICAAAFGKCGDVKAVTHAGRQSKHGEIDLATAAADGH